MTTALALFMAFRPRVFGRGEEVSRPSILSYLLTAVAGFAFGKKASK